MSVYFCTKRMGSCHCGDCFAEIFEDGRIQYHGMEDWQRSDVIDYDPSATRPYGSHIKPETYNRVMDEIGAVGVIR